MRATDPVMKPRRFIAALLACLPLLPRMAFAGLPPHPPCRFPFDVSKRDNKLEQEFRVLNYRNFYFAFQFDYLNDDDLWRVLKLVGRGSTYPDGRYAEPGVSVSVQLKISRIVANGSDEIVVDETKKTQGLYGQGFSQQKFAGNFRRMIASVGLEPGLYRVELTTTEDTPEFSGTPSHLNIEPHSKALPPKRIHEAP